jgi:glycosyltransferase involved in cell wall biosynthesis
MNRVLCVIPAYNEASNLPTVVAEVRTQHPDLDILVVDDGSTDVTMAVVRLLGVRWLRMPERMGIGSAMRAGLHYSLRTGYDAVIRMDGDGQHRAADIDRLLTAVRIGHADIAIGSRYQQPRIRGNGLIRVPHRLLAAVLSAVTGRPVTDPTSGFYALGPRAMRMLAEHHPTGYPEPELRLFLRRNALSVVEVDVRARSRLRGRTSLTLIRVTAAVARVALAVVIVPLRRRVKEAARV